MILSTFRYKCGTHHLQRRLVPISQKTRRDDAQNVSCGPTKKMELHEIRVINRRPAIPKTTKQPSLIFHSTGITASQTTARVCTCFHVRYTTAALQFARLRVFRMNPFTLFVLSWVVVYYQTSCPLCRTLVADILTLILFCSILTPVCSVSFLFLLVLFQVPRVFRFLVSGLH